MFEKIKNRNQNVPTSTELENTATKYPAQKHESESSSRVKEAHSLENMAIDSPEHLLFFLESQKCEFPEDMLTIRIYLNKIQLKLKNRVETNTILDQMTSSSAKENAAIAVSESTPSISIDASVELILPASRMVVFLCVLPPVGSGKPIDAETIFVALKEKEVLHGINNNLIEHIASKQSYGIIYPVARGTAPTNGKDGEIIDHFARTQQIKLVEDERGSIDYKSLNIFQNVKANQIICDIIPPTTGQDGFNIYGKTLKSLSGKPAVIPRGTNTSMNEECTALISDVDGNLFFIDGHFSVNPQLVIPNNVDASTGNLKFSGDILIHGDVQKGFKIEAGGDIIIRGMAESAIIIAGGDIEIQKGMNGGGEGNLHSGGCVRAQFLEQTTVYAENNVYTQTIINCKIKSGGSIYALDGVGSIIAGSLIVHRSVEAKKIGNLSNIRTIIEIGHSVRETENEEYLTSELKKKQAVLTKLNKNINFLEYLPEIPADKQELYQKLKEQQSLYQMEVLTMSAQLAELTNQKFDYSMCHVRGGIVYGTTVISLGFSRQIIKETTYRCNIYADEGVLRLGTF